MAIVEKNGESWSEITGKLIRSALGKVAYIGELYDARTEMFCSRSLFSSSFPKNLIKTQQNSKCEIGYSYKDQLSDRFNLLKVEAELQLPILLGLFSLQGHGKYLYEEKISERIVSCSLLYHFSTVCEKLMAAFNEIEEYVDKDVFRDEQYTHVVVEINWGANCTVSLEHYNKDSSRKKEAEGLLKVELQKLGWIIKPDVGGSTTCNDTNNNNVNHLELKVYADVLPNGNIPNTVEKAVEFISTLPQLLNNVNDGKGKPLNYVMIPISTFKKIFNLSLDNTVTSIIKSIDESFIIQLIYFFEELAVLKQKLNDMGNDFSSHEKYLPSDCLPQIRKMQQSIKANEAQLKTDLAEDLPNVRAGKLAIRDLIKKAEKHKSVNLNLIKIEEFIDNFGPMKNKINNVNLCLSKNIIYLGKGESLDYLISKNTNDEFFVLYTSKKLNEKNSELSRETFNFFLTQSEFRSENMQYVIIDLDITTEIGYEVEDVKVVHYKNGRLVSGDVFKDYEEESNTNFAKLVKSTLIEYVPYKPLKRVVLELPCPGFRLGTCSKDPLNWTCEICKDNLEYDFNGFFYCACGKAPVQAYKLRCSSSGHGYKYLSLKDNFAWSELGKLRPLKEMNILILGQSGVGKSTWINSIVNYLLYDTLEDAEKGGAVCVIPANFTVTYMAERQIMKQVVEIGESDSNEITKVGKSATQEPKTYNFNLSDRTVRLIDTPGLGDTEGIDRDKENMKKILDHISFLKEIHGICFLLKSNETRIHAIFKFCITELLSHLHKNAAKNILFCFTNSRSSFYSPGDTSVVLDSLLKELNLDDMIALCENTMFCLDNEAFRFLCMLKYPNIPHSADDHKVYAASWKKSVTETKRLFQQIKDLEPHTVTDTTTLCNARNRILNLTKPIAEITQTIQLNLAAIKEEEDKIRNNRLSLDELASRLHMPHIELQPEPLDYPRTVCTSLKCVKFHKLTHADVTLIEYAQICHDRCGLKRIITDAYPQNGLKRCSSMQFQGLSIKCKRCGCSWDRHMHITYTQKRVETSVVDTDVAREISHKEDSKARIEEHKRQLEETTEEYEFEQKIIMQISLQFGKFLKENAIAPYNDGFKDYLEYLIEQEKNKVQKTRVDNNLLKNLHEMMKRYEVEVQILGESMKNTTEAQKLTPKEIAALENKLYNLKLTGEQIKRNAELSATSGAKAQRYAEKPLPVRNRRYFDSKRKKDSSIRKIYHEVKDFILN